MITRVIFSDNTVLKDFSVSLDNFHGDTEVFDYTTVDDFLFIGSLFPFSHTYFDLSVLNVVAATVTVEYWDGNAFIAMAEVIDETVGLTKSGFLNFVPDRNKKWTREDTVNNSGTERITGLGGKTRYDLYWLRISYNATLTLATAFNWIGPKFSIDDDLGSEYPDLLLSDSLTGFEAGKTDWEEQVIRAARLIIERLKNETRIMDGNQLMDRTLFRTASVSKVAEIALNGLGQDFKEDRDDARKQFGDRMAQSFLNIDRDLDGRLDEFEARRLSQGTVLRR